MNLQFNKYWLRRRIHAEPDTCCEVVPPSLDPVVTRVAGSETIQHDSRGTKNEAQS